MEIQGRIPDLVVIKAQVGAVLGDMDNAESIVCSVYSLAWTSRLNHISSEKKHTQQKNEKMKKIK